MIKFFRHIRKSLIEDNKMGKYFKYAIGEILLVVIGILLALQINTWKESRANRQLEIRYLTNMLGELRTDSVGINNKLNQVMRQAQTKNQFLDMVKGKTEVDSLFEYFKIQWAPIFPYKTLNATYSEMTSSGHLAIIRNDPLREQIIKTYNQFDDLKENEAFFIDFYSEQITTMSAYFRDMYNPTYDEIINIGQHGELTNSIRLNGANSRAEFYKKAMLGCEELIKSINDYKQNIE
ncbi:MAG: hypothetical protein ED556_02030 [Winogradskyella sp.]|uniref:DUF6090 family protein n=1 Tax=Winogradskyella sp. TaxID=1883156 RepID=UPI000F3E1DB1|nr:DUF6090 family protein [Winogradskyella sp.]RNC87991.1 MAG: hypothetical protein ED556_02030 [Winogradskyella sp.]